MTMSGRGTDIRFENNDRIGAHERKALKKARRAPGNYGDDVGGFSEE
jgi:GTP-binding protein